MTSSEKGRRLWGSLFGIVLALALAVGSTGGVVSAEDGDRPVTRTLTLTKVVPKMHAELVPAGGFEIQVNTVPYEFEPDQELSGPLALLYSQEKIDISVSDDIVLKESVPDGWKLFSASCADVDGGRGANVGQYDPATGSVQVEAGDYPIWCSFYNIAEWRPVHITKKISPLDALVMPPDGFVFSVHGGKYRVIPDAEDEDGMIVGHRTVWVPVDETIVISEDLSAPWQLLASSCEEEDSGSIRQPFALLAAPDEYRFDAGRGPIHCEFENKLPPSVIIEKRVDGASGASFDFWIDAYSLQNGGDGEPSSSERLTSLKDGEAHWVEPELVYVQDQTVVIREKLPNKRWQVSITCNGSYGGVTIGESGVAFTNVTSLNTHIVCTFTNTPPPSSPTEPWTPPPPPPPPTPDPDPNPDPDPQPDPQPQVIPDPTPIPPDTPAAPPDLPVTGGTYVWHFLSGAGLFGSGVALLRRRRT